MGVANANKPRPPLQAQQLLVICREYIVGLSMEILRKELPKVSVSSFVYSVFLWPNIFVVLILIGKSLSTKICPR